VLVCAPRVGRAEDRSALADAEAARSAERSGPVALHASDVEIDARTREAILKGDVRVDAPPFHLHADELRVRRDARGAVDVEGTGRLAFCPCLGTPLAVRFAQATIAPPGDLILRSPSLEILGAPVFWLPYFWLRGPEKPGVLPPDVAYRGGDGMFLGDGIHVPLRKNDASTALDLRAGGYFEGGAAVEGVMKTESTVTRVAWDHLRGDGVTLDAHGAMGADGGVALAWEADAIRGARGVLATTDVRTAAMPYDRVAGETSFRDGGWTVATSVRAIAPRGGDVRDLGAAGPVIAVRRGDAIGSVGTYDVTAEGAALHDATRTLSFARGDAGALLADRWGPVGASLSLRAAGDVAADGEPAVGAALDGAASARARLALPFVRAFPADHNDPWTHRLEPAVEAALLSVHGSDLLGVMPGRGASVVRGESLVLDAALLSQQGRWGARIGSEVAVAGGIVSGGSQDGALLRGHAAISSAAAALTGEVARVWRGGGSEGGAFTARARVGPQGGLRLVVLGAERDGIDPVLARVLTDAPLEPSSGFLAATGWTGGSYVGVPWTEWLTTTGGADVDLTARLLVAARGAVEVRDRCGCVRVRANAAHRIGRDGIDAWVTIDLAPR
jgi:hypothetical protein